MIWLPIGLSPSKADLDEGGGLWDGGAWSENLLFLCWSGGGNSIDGGGGGGFISVIMFTETSPEKI